MAESGKEGVIGRNKWSSTPLEALLQQLGADPTNGLSEAEVTTRRAKYGMNELEKEKRDSVLKMFLMQFTSPVVIMLQMACVACLASGEYVDGCVVFGIVFFNACLATYTEKNAGDALERLAKMAAPKCNCIREGKESLIDASLLVPGDMVLLRTGDGVPADCRLTECMEVLTNEALLTGESEEVVKVMIAPDPDEPFAKNMCFMSSTVTNGSGRCVVTTTGMATQVGAIAGALKTAKRAENKLTPLQQALNRLGGMIGAISITVLIAIVIIAIARDYRDPAHPEKGQVLTVVMCAVGFAVSSVPEGLPMVVTICLALGCQDMVRRMAQVRQLPAVETLGSCSVICSDKTGTLTEGKMTALRLFTFVRGVDKGVQPMSFWPTKGFNPNGGLFKTDELTNDKKDAMNQLYDQGKFQQYDGVLRDLGNPSCDDPTAVGARALMMAGYLNCYGTVLNKDPEDPTGWKPKGNMSEGAVVVAAAKCRIGKVVNPNEDAHGKYSLIKELEVPFSSVRKMMVTFHNCAQGKPGMLEGVNFGENAKDAKAFAIVKGAPEMIMPIARYSVTSGGAMDFENPMKKEESDLIVQANGAMAEGALRVLAFGVMPITDEDMTTLRSMGKAEERLTWMKEQARKTCFLGLIGNLDPPRVGVKQAVQSCREAGIRVIMITGDQVNTAAAIARDIALLRKEDDPAVKALVCSKMHNEDNSMKSDAEIDEYVSRVDVFSRAQPEDKIAIVHAFQRKQEVVGMTGDGVNDAPALKAADIGIAMGLAGTDVAKGAADMVLLDDNFVTIVAAVEEGRKIYGNLQKFVSFLLGTNIGEVWYLATSIIVGLPVPLMALQIIFLNLMSDGCPAVALCREPKDPMCMLVPPRPKSANIMTRDWWCYGNLPHCFFESLGVLGALSAGLYTFTGETLTVDIQALCEQALYDDKLFPIFCVCTSKDWHDTGGSWDTRIEWYVPSHDSGEDVIAWYNDNPYSKFKGDTSVKAGTWVKSIRKGQVLTRDEAFAEVKAAGELPAKDKDGNALEFATWQDLTKWQMKDEMKSKASLRAMYRNDYYQKSACSPNGALKGRTFAFVAAVYCEMMRAYTVRCAPGTGMYPQWMWQVLNRNPWMHFACTISFWSTIAVTLIPTVTDAFHTHPLPFFAYVCAIMFPVGNLICDEMVPKPLYIMKLNAEGGMKTVTGMAPKEGAPGGGGAYVAPPAPVKPLVGSAPVERE